MSGAIHTKKILPSVWQQCSVANGDGEGRDDVGAVVVEDEDRLFDGRERHCYRRHRCTSHRCLACL